VGATYREPDRPVFRAGKILRLLSRGCGT
jgi:hypothetical protein